MKTSVLVGFMYCLTATGMATSSWAAQEEKGKASDRNRVRLLVAGSLTAEPVAHAVTYDAIYGAQFGVGVQDSDSNSAFVSACGAQFPSKRNQIVKTFAGLPFVVESLTPDKDVELPDPIRITLVGGVKEMAWKDTKSSRQPGKNHIDGQEGGVRLNGMWLLAAGTSVMDWGVLRQNRGQNIAIPERHLNKPRVWATLAKSSLIIPSAGSEVPCLCDKEGFPLRIVPNAMGVIWVFDKARTEIQVGTQRYVAEKDGATIEFTSSGVVMKGVTASQSVQKSASQEDAMSWKETTTKNNLDAYQGFLERFPKSSFATPARQAIDAAFANLDVTKIEKGPGRVFFGADLQAPLYVALTSKEGQKEEFECSLSHQDDAMELTEENGKVSGTPVSVSFYKGYPFACDKVAVDNKKMFVKPLSLEISRVESGFAIPSKENAVPLQMRIGEGGRLSVKPWVRAIGVTWILSKKEIVIRVGESEYESQQPGAKISFTKYGVILEDMKLKAESSTSDKTK